MAGYAYPYTLEDDIAILRYILDGNYVSVVKGNTLWKRMEKEKLLPNRTWQSLRNRFMKTIVQDSARPEYGLSKDEITAFKIRLSRPLGRAPSTTPKRNVDPRLVKDNHQKYLKNKETRKSKEGAQAVPESEDKFYSLDMDSSSSDDDD